METGMWPLLAFTLLVQAAVGTFLAVETTALFSSRKLGSEISHRLRFRSRSGILALLLTALLVSFFHLGSPEKAYQALINLDSSWLSREVGLVLVFIILMGLLILLGRRRTGRLLEPLTCILGGTVGIVLVFVMAKIYMIPTVPAWDTLATPLMFFSTTFLLGSLAAALLHHLSLEPLKTRGEGFLDSRKGKPLAALKWMILLVLLLVLVAMTATILFGSRQWPFRPTGRILFCLRILLLLLGASGLLVLLCRSQKEESEEKGLGLLFLSVFVAIVLSEFLGRYLFFVSFNRVGL